MTTLLAQAFSELDQWLAQHKPLWDVQSFHHLDWPWWDSYPDLCAWLAQQTQTPDVTTLERALLTYVPSYYSAPAMTVDQTTQKRTLTPLPSYFGQGIKGRKWQQIVAFSEAVDLSSPTIEWCAGKGHLGKVIAQQHQVAVLSLEWQASLCDAGTKEAQRLNVDQTFSHADVLKGEGDDAFKQARSAIALHACGDLHRVLIERGITAKLDTIAVSPCCYHLTQDESYQPLSLQARYGQTYLTKDNLKLAVKEVVTAGQREQRLKQLELSYRLGFDTWQRDVTGVNQYLPVPSCPKVLLQKGFFGFCKWAAEQKSLAPFDHTTNAKDYEQIGQQRSVHVAMIESVMQHFRKPLELWLVLDRALCLEENGYQVSITEFCEKDLTPRNLLIYAKL